jgi:hypothetical protein
MFPTLNDISLASIITFDYPTEVNQAIIFTPRKLLVDKVWTAKNGNDIVTGKKNVDNQLVWRSYNFELMTNVMIQR